MKRLLLLPILLMGLTFACDQPHEDVRGYKIGCPLELHKDMKFKSKKDAVEIYTVANYEDIYTDVSLYVLNGNLEKVNLNTSIITDTESRITKDALLKNLNARWGKFDIEDRGDVISGEISPIKNKPLGKISFEAVFDDNSVIILNLTYISTRMIAYDNPKQNLNLLDGI